MTILIFIAVLFVLILVHEWGHFIVAKKTGMRVDEFGIGFPPKLFGFSWRGTLYTLNLFPIGGFVRILGEDGSTVASSDSFGAKSKWAQSAVLVAGVTMNVILAWFLFVFVFMYGVPTVVDEGVAGSDAKLVVTHLLKDSPAQKAGIPVGAAIVKYGEGEELTPSAFREYVSSGESARRIVIETNDGVKEITLTPTRGLIEENSDTLAVGVGLALVERVSQPFHTALLEATKTTYQSLIAITVGLSSLIIDIIQSDADFSQVAGPVGIVGLVGEAAEFGLASLLLFTAMISLNLAVINLLPFPALDGGRLLFVVVETVIKRPINPVWMARINTVGFFLLIALMVLVTINDFSK